jgi:uncharacterized protein YegP (UPF0339 family)
MNRFEAFQDMQDNWRWRLVTDKDRVVTSSSASFESREEALRVAREVKALAASAPVADVPGVGPKEMIARLIRREEARRLEVAVAGNRRAAKRRPGRSRRGPVGDPGPRLRVVGERRGA